MRTIATLTSVFLLLSVGCVQYHYTPNCTHTPYIEKKGDGVVSAGVGGSLISINGDFHGSYSPIKYGTVMVNYFRNRSSFEDTDIFGGQTYLKSSKGYLVEGALGAYTPFGFGTGALYVGLGQGQMRNDYGDLRIADLTLQRFFIQPTFTYRKDWFRLGMALRLIRLSYPSGKVDYRIDTSDIQVIERLEQDSPFWFPELGGNMGIHFEPVTISAHMVLIASRIATNYGFDTSNIGLSLSFELQEMFKKKEKK